MEPFIDGTIHRWFFYELMNELINRLHSTHLKRRGLEVRMGSVRYSSAMFPLFWNLSAGAFGAHAEASFKLGIGLGLVKTVL